MNEELPDLRDPLSGPAASHPGTLALPATLLSWGSCLTGLLVLATFEVQPAWRPGTSLALVAALFGLALAAAVAWAGHRRAGPFFPRLWVLLLAAACLLVASLLAFGPTALRAWLTGPALALFAATVALLPRLERRRLVPHHRRLASIGLLGPILGITVALALSLLGALTLDVLVPSENEQRLALERIRLCRELERAWIKKLEPTVRGQGHSQLDALEALERHLASTPDAWPGLAEPETDTEMRAACAQAASALRDTLVSSPAPSSLAVPAFEHRPRPESAGELVANLPRDPAPACRLHQTLAATAYALARRLDTTETGSAESLRRALETRRSALAGDWLDGWLLPCLDGRPVSKNHVPERPLETIAIESALATPPGFESGRPDRWLQLTLGQARDLATTVPACSLRPTHEDRQRRWQAFDCVLIGPSRHDGDLAILAEIGLVYASALREKNEEELPAIAQDSRPATLRLLLDDGGKGDLHTRAVSSLRSFESALATGGRLDSPPGSDPRDSAAWRFGLRFGEGPEARASRLEGTISRRILPGGREGTLFVLRRAEGAP